MTVTNKKAHPVLTNLGTLLQPEESGGEPQLKAAALANKVATAGKVLATTPSLHALALEVVSNGLLFQCSLYDHSPQLAQEEGALASTLSEVWVLLESLLSHCPQGWSSKLFKWSVSLLGRFSISYKSPSSPEEATRAWLNNPLLAPVHSFIKQCADYLVESGMGLHCMECLFPACSMHAPNLNWLLAHVVSLHPSSLMPVLLHHTLSTPPSSSNPSTDPGFTTLTQALTHLSRTHKDTLRDCVVSLVTDLLSSANRPELHKILFLLRVASECPPVLEIAAAQCLEKLNPASIQDLLIQSVKLLSSSESHDRYEGRGGASDEEDEGEIVSDDEEMQVDGSNPSVTIRGDEIVQLIANLVCQLKGTEACVAINKVIDTHARVENYLKTQEEAMEEGEIVHNSTGKAVAESCKSLMIEILTRMHSSACLPHLIPGQAPPKAPSTGQGPSQVGVASDGCGLELTIGLQCGLEQWCRRLLDLVRESSLGLTCSWLQEVITCVCISSSEFQAASAVAQLLSLSTDTHQLSKVLEIYWELQVRHSHLAHTTVQAAISSAQHQMTTPTRGDCWTDGDGGGGGEGETNAMENGHGRENGGGFSQQEEDEGEEMFGNFISNLMVVLKEGGGKRGGARKEQHSYDITAIRSQFQRALSEQVLYLTQLLSPSLLLLCHAPHHTNKRHLLLLFDLIYSVLNPQNEKQDGRPSSSVSSQTASPPVVVRLSSQSLCRVLQALLSHYFSMMKMAARSILKSGSPELAMEAALGKCRRLIIWCTTYNYPSPPPPSPPPSTTAAPSASPKHSNSTAVLAYSAILEAVLSKDISHYFSLQTLTKVQSSSVRSSGRLLSTNSHLGLSTLHGAKQSTRRVYHTGSLQLRNQKTSVENNNDFAQPCVTHTLCQLMQLLQALTSPSSHSTTTNKDTLASVLLDKLAPHATDLKQWPDEESLKYSLEWDLTVKRQLDNHPVLWELLLFVSEGGRESSSLCVCAPVVRALLTVLSQHWQRCRVNKTTMFPKELTSSVSLIECLARAEWLPRPLCYIGELFALITPNEAYLLLTAVNTYLKVNYASIKSKQFHQLGDTGYHEMVKGVLVKNIQHFGSHYARYITTRHDKTSTV